MERQKIKKRKDYRDRRHSKLTSSLPNDLTAQILSWLPENLVARFRCVSKLWLSITTDPYFINLLETRRPRPSLLLCIRRDDDLFVASIPQHTHTLHQNSNKSYSSSQPIDHYHTKFPQEYTSSFRPTESVHGLICFQNSGTAIVWNPSKREFLTLPKPRKSWRAITVLLGYDPIERKHKVVCIPLQRSSHVCRVLTLGSPQESWRTVKTNHMYCTDYHTSGQCINGVIYYLAYIYTRVWVIMSFDVRSEKFHMIQLPSDIYQDVLINYGGRLACVDKKNRGRLWILEDAKKHKWSSQDYISPFDHLINPTSVIYLSLKGFTHTGEFIFVRSSVYRLSPYIFFWDPVRNSFRRFVLEGIVGNEYGLHNDDHTFELYAFPNHIDGQISM